ncbi:WD40/YVTN/BNR-like repeat-containing protein [Denitromonas iodatirespirans]|uniref:Photosynthesis system II assembly factor Ycf48/Hcf136-like domain-containing protein n=1 Tax=Denitromonas iodatirespirans TaxID=2795389 RepID=A0A944H922_DENI1|nr:YCF48-related protein [Denitromonas iodatirespirans]MBT0962948.1 hypothetical protein [Denitromonas iodatirespirans]
MKRILIAAACALASGINAAAEAPAAPAVLERPALKTSRAQHMAMLAITRAGARLVSVGEAGVVLLSDDDGKTWRQADVPASVSLTAVQFVDDSTGYATGHMGVVLKTTDAGAHWKTLLDGIRAAELTLKHAQAAHAALPAEADADRVKAADRQLKNAELLVADGPDKPFLGLHFSDADNGFVFGAYNLILRTRDGGKTWTPWNDRVANPRGLHLYGMTSAQGRLFLAGEQGLLLRADADGARFAPIDSPYKGSYFGIERSGDVVVAYGLRGNAFRSTDGGDSWQKVDAGVNASISGAVALPDGGLMLLSQRGDLLVATDPRGHFDLRRAEPPLPLAGLAIARDGTPVAASLAGVQRLAPVTP